MNKLNPWMLSTIFLFGLIIGFGVGRLNFGASSVVTTPTTAVADAANTAANSGTALNGSADPSAAVTPPSAPDTSLVNDYSNITTTADTNHYSIGNKNAKVKIMDFSDFECPFCYRYFSTAFPSILKDYIAQGKVYYTWYNYPLNIHPNAPAAAEAAMCAGEQNKFWEFHDLLFSNQNLWADSSNPNTFFESLAQTAGLDSGKFNSCLSSSKYAQVIENDMNLGDSKGVSGTPTIFVNDQKVVGAQDYVVFKQTIDQELSK